MMILIALFVLLSATSVNCRDVTVTTELGNITGHTNSFKFIGVDHIITQFLGIPYAEPPKRFERPESKKHFSEPFVANTSPPWCYQNPAGIRILYDVDPSTLDQSEDCLYLNIYIPGEGQIDTTNPRAVLIWIYGGAFQQGSQDWYNAKALVALNNIILVTFNYRLSALGFLSLPKKRKGLPGNYGLWDQQMAIEFVHRYISSFGGDPLRVTIAGESAGASSVVYQALYKDNDGLFHRAIAQSGSINNGFAYENDPTGKFWSFAKTLHCNASTPKRTIDCINNKPVDDLMAAIEFDTVFKPVVDGEFVTVHPVELFLNKTEESWAALQRFGKIDFIFGVNSDDGGLLLGFIAGVFDLLGDDPAETDIRNTFETAVLPFAMSFAQYEQTELLNSLIVNQYLNWSAPRSVKELMQKSTDVFSDTLFNFPSQQSAMTHHNTQQSGNLYTYVFNHKLPISPSDRYSGANHEDELIYVLGIPQGRLDFIFKIQLDDQASLFKGCGASWTSSLVFWSDINLSLKMMEYWSNFVKTGNPNTGDGENSKLTNWPEYDVTTQKYIRFDDGLGGFPIEQRYVADRIHFWHHVVSYLRNYEEECKRRSSQGKQ